MSGTSGERVTGPAAIRAGRAPRTPVVLGIGARVGATTLAAALHAHDGGQGGVAADVVVCAATEESLRQAEALGCGPVRPLLAVVATAPGGMGCRPGDAAHRYASTTVLPHVERWRGLAGPTDEIVTLLGCLPDLLTPALRAYADGLREIAAGMLRSGQLDHDRPPPVTRPVVLPRQRGAATVVLPAALTAAAHTAALTSTTSKTARSTPGGTPAPRPTAAPTAPTPPHGRSTPSNTPSPRPAAEPTATAHDGTSTSAPKPAQRRAHSAFPLVPAPRAALDDVESATRPAGAR